ncbi:MAG: spore protease YyaC [Clostridia bacterium]|nr:spore protease YyaC [Clostridia bacterium]
MQENNLYIEYIKNLEEKISILQNKNNIIFCCIGTDRVIGDCIGPITGSLLKNRINSENIYGDLQENLTFNNMNKKINEINSKFKNPFIIAVDAALSDEKNIGKIFVEDSGILIGKGLNKKKKSVGDIGIKVVVGKDYNDNELNFKTLQNVSLNEVIYLSKIISDGIANVLNK